MFYDMRIYNRYGQQVYYTNNAANGWDGTFRDQPAEAGAYMYAIKYTNRYTDETEIENGDVILMR
jgi:gliding motility-associated-like protein